MKVIKVILIILMVLIILTAVTVIAFLKNIDLNRLKPQFCEEMSRIIGRTVTVERVRLDLSPTRGVVFEVDGLRVKDDPQFSDGYFASVGLIQCELDVFRFLQERTLVFTHLNIRSPKITLIRNNKGLLNLPGTNGSSSPKAATEDKANSDPTSDVAPARGLTALPALRVVSIRVIEGTLTFLDQMTASTNPLVVDKIAFEIDNLSLEQRFPFRLDCALMSRSPNIHLDGEIQFDFLRMQIRLTDVALHSNLEKISLAELSKALPSLAGTGIKKIDGILAARCPIIILNNKGLARLTLRGDLSGGLVALKFLAKPISEISFKLEANEQQADLRGLFARMGSGNIKGKATCADYQKSPHYNFELSSENILAEELVPLKGTDVQAEGKANFSLKGEGQVKAGEDPLNQLAALGWVKADGLKLKNVNVLKTILGRISLIPGLYDLVYQNLPQEDREKLSRDYVIFQKAEGDIVVKNGVFSLPRVDLVSDGAMFKGKADLDAKLNLHFSGDVVIPKDLSGRIVQSAKQLGGLQDSEGQIQIPLASYEGNLSSFKIMPNLEAIGKRIFVSEGKKQIENLLDKAFGVEKQPNPQPENDPASAEPAPETEKSSAQQAIEGLLNAVLDKLP